MGNPRGFLEIDREESGYRPVEERLHDYSEVEKQLPDERRRQQAARCMDCGVPFCHWACPLENSMPEWQEMLYRGDWKAAYDILQDTDNFPEFTGRVCPALCEASCVLAVNGDAVTIRQNELAVIEKAFSEGYVQPRPPERRTGKRVAVIGSGPAGLACADMLNRFGHTVTLYEAADSVGGYLRFGIPDFKLEKSIIDRRVNILREEGLIIRTGVRVGTDCSAADVRKENDAICIAIGAREPRDLPAEGRDLTGIHFALEYLVQQNRIVRGDSIPEAALIKAFDKDVVVIGGGDTGADCVGSLNRQGARSVVQLEILPQPPERRSGDEPWPLWPKILRHSSSHEEGCERMWSVLVKRFSGTDGAVTGLSAASVAWESEDGKMIMREIAGSSFDLKADLVILAMGFIHVVHEGLVADLGVDLDSRGNIATDENCMAGVEGVFAAGDSVRGASLVVLAIQQGRETARAIDRYLNT